MANYYADFTLGTFGLGSPASPFDPAQVIDFTNPGVGAITSAGKTYLQNGDVIKIRNFNVNSGYDHFISPNVTMSAFTLQGWGNESANEYWGLSNSPSEETYLNLSNIATSANIVFNNGIFYKLAESYMVLMPPKGIVNFINSIFYGEMTLNWYPVSATGNKLVRFNGCTFAQWYGMYIIAFGTYGGYGRTVPVSGEFNDCVFNNMQFSGQFVTGDALTFNRCWFSDTSAFTLGSVSGATITTNNCTFSWGLAGIQPAPWAVTRDQIVASDYNISSTFMTSGNVASWTSNNMLTAAFGSNRRGPGSFYYPTNVYYVNLNAITTGAGTSASPFNATQLFNYYTAWGVINGDVLKVSGTTSYGDCLRVTDFGVDSWGTDPWRLSISGTSDTNTYAAIQVQNTNALCYVKNGILVVDDPVHFVSMVYYCSAASMDVLNENVMVSASRDTSTGRLFEIISSTTSANSMIVFKGSTFICNVDTATIHQTNVTSAVTKARSYFMDCVFDLPISIGLFGTGSSAVFDNCVSRDATGWIDGAGHVIVNNCQTGWTPPTWPNVMTAPTSAFAYSKLTAGTHQITVSGAGQW